MFVEHEVTPLVTRVLEQGTPVIMIDAGPDELGEQQGARRLGPVARVLANGLAREFSTTGMLRRLLGKLTGRPEVSAWVWASELLARPEEVLVGVEAVDEDPLAGALVERAAAILQTASQRGPGALGRAWSRLFDNSAKASSRRSPGIAWPRRCCSIATAGSSSMSI